MSNKTKGWWQKKEGVRWVLANIIFLIFIISGFVFESEGAKNIAIFWVWVFIVSNLFTGTDDWKQNGIAEGKMPDVPRAAITWFGLLCLAFLLWDGWFLTSTVLFASMCAHESGYEELEKELAIKTEEVSQPI